MSESTYASTTVAADLLASAQHCLDRRVPLGEPPAVRVAAAAAAARAADLDRVSPLLVSAAEESGWTGRAAREFGDALRGVAGDIPPTATRYRGYAEALTRYAAELEVIVVELQASRARVDAEFALLRRNLPLQLSGPSDELLPRHCGAAASALSAATERARVESPLRGAVSAFEGCWRRYQDAAGRCSRAILQADAADPGRDRTGWRAFEHALARGMRYLVPFAHFTLNPSWQELSDALSIVGTELTAIGIGLLFVFPPAGAVCLAAAAVVSAGQLAVDCERRFGQHDKSVGNFDLAMDLLGAIPVGGAAFRGARYAGRFAEAGRFVGVARPATAGAAVLERGAVLVAAARAGSRECARGLDEEAALLRKLPSDYFRSAKEIHGGSKGLIRRWAPNAWDGINAGMTWPGLPEKQQRGIPERIYDVTLRASDRAQLMSRISLAK